MSGNGVESKLKVGGGGGGGARLIKNLDKQKIPKPLTVTMVTLTLFYAVI